MRTAVRRFHAEGGTILAECGGMMACARLARRVGSRVSDVGPDPGAGRDALTPRRAGVRDGCVRPADPARSAGDARPGSRVPLLDPRTALPLPFATRLLRPDRDPKPDGVQIGGLLAGYAHLHFGSNPEVARHLLGAARK